MSTGWDTRLSILRGDTERKLLEPLRTHGWTASVEREVEHGEYLIVTAERSNIQHRVAVLYSSATDNAVYRSLSPQVEHIFVRGELYKLQSYAYGISTPISTADDFHSVLINWNSVSSHGKFASDQSTVSPIAAEPPKQRTLLSEEPIEAIWLRLRQLTSITIARNLIATRAADEGVKLTEEVVRAKAEGVAYSLRNANDYFRTRDGQYVSRIVNLYYGSMAFAFAEMLASPKGPDGLADIERMTMQGHGLCTLDGGREGLEHVVVSTLATGFFASWMKFLGIPTGDFPTKKPKLYSDLAKQAATSWLTVEQLFARIPEVGDLFLEIFLSKPAWVTPIYDNKANPPLFNTKQRPTTTYSIFVDDSARLTAQDIAALPGPISQISEIASNAAGRHFRVAVDATGKQIWWDALPIHYSPFKRTALIVPAFGSVGEYRAICIALLYAALPHTLLNFERCSGRHESYADSRI